MVFVVFVCVAGFVALGGVSADEKNAGDPYGKANLHDAFRQRTKTTPYGYAKSLLSILYAFRGWYETIPFGLGYSTDEYLGKTPIMLDWCSVLFFELVLK